MGLLSETPHSEITATMEVLGNHGVTREGLTSLRKNPDLAAKVVLLIMVSVRTIYHVMMRTMTLAEMIKACNCGYNHPDINAKNFPIQNTGKQSVDLVLVKARDIIEWLIAQGQAAAGQGWVTTKQVVDYMVSHGLLEALIEHLLAFGAANPDAQRESPIIALGSSFVSGDGLRGCPCLRSLGNERGLDLDWDVGDGHWLDDCRFLALRK